MEITNSSWVLRVSDEIFLKLLVLYPQGYRQNFGLEMRQTFQDACYFTHQKNGLAGLFFLWLPTLFDLLVTAIKKHFEEGFFIRKRKPIRILSLILLLFGIFGSATKYGVINNILVAPFLLAAGVTGLYFTGEEPKQVPIKIYLQHHQRIQGAYQALFLTMLYASVILLGGLISGTDQSAQELGGPVGYLSMVTAHLVVFFLTLRLYRRVSLWAVPLAVAMGLNWVKWGYLGLVARLVSANGYYLLLDLGKVLFGALTMVTALRAIPILLNGAKQRGAE